MTSYIRLFEHLYVEISMMPSFSAFGYTKSSQKSENILFHLVPPQKMNEEFFMKWIKSIKCKLTIAWRIFYLWFSFWRKLFWKRFEDNNTCYIFLNFVCAFSKNGTFQSTLWLFLAKISYYFIKFFRMLQEVHGAKYI